MKNSEDGHKPPGWWLPADTGPQHGDAAIRTALLNLKQPVYLVGHDGRLGVAQSGTVLLNADPPAAENACPLVAQVPPLEPQDFGSRQFKNSHGLKYAYVAGAMANGISSVEMVAAAAKAGMVGFFGAAGLLPREVASAIDRLEEQLADEPYGFNLIHSPIEPELEAAVADLYLRRGIRLVSASAYLNLTLPLIRYRYSGIRRDAGGRIVCPNRVIAKVSRIEVARKFLSPPPRKLLTELVGQGLLDEKEAELASFVPVAQDLTAEADSGGHTDNRPAITLLPTMLALRDQLAGQYGYDTAPDIGLGGGISTPQSTAAAFAMGAAYVLTGSVNQGCIEAGTSAAVRRMLAEARQADVAMAPSADMFEMGVKVQVLKRGTMFAQRASKLYELYSTYQDYDSIPADQRAVLEKDYFRRSFDEEWQSTQSFFRRRDPRQIDLAAANPRHRMALVFRSYLGQSSGWANRGEPARQMDYQIWCGPSMGAFNQWVQGSYLEAPQNRQTVTIASNLLVGAAMLTRVNWLQQQGVSLQPAITRFQPMTPDELAPLMSASSGNVDG
jgi:PfaD family protein